MEKMMYVAPELEVLEVMVEKGFATSPSEVVPDTDFGGSPAPF